MMIWLGMALGGVGTDFTFLVPIPYSHVVNRYPTHIQLG
jgi:hypothetical protein